MKKMILGAAVALATLTAGAAMAQPYGYSYNRGAYAQNYRYDNRGYRDSDRDGISDRAEWNRDRDRDGRPDQYDRYDNRRDRHWDRRHHRHHHYDRWDNRYDRDWRW